MHDELAFQHWFGSLLAGIAQSNDPALRRALAVHRNTSHKAALDALTANFPVLAALAGEQAFAACASAFVDRQPPADPRLCLYGAGFADHVAGWDAFARHRYFASVARLEWLVVTALFAADAAPLDAARIAANPDPDMPLRLHPATRIASFDDPVVSMWLAHQPDAELSLADIDWQVETALVTRGGALQVTPIDAATAAFLTAPTLGSAAHAAHEQGGDISEIFARLLAAAAFADPTPPHP